MSERSVDPVKIASDVVTVAIDSEVAVVTINSPPVNTLSNAVRAGIDLALTAALDATARAVVITCAGKTFIAGAEIGELGTASDAIGLHDLLAKIENAPVPVVVAIHGTCLGGGLELALCAHARVAVPSAKLGFPEVKLGLLPGAGGTQRLPRLVSVEDALDVIVTGKHIPAPKAEKMGFVERIAPEGELVATAVALAKELAAIPGKPVRVRDREERIAQARANPGAIDAWRKANAKLLKGAVAPSYNVRCVETALSVTDFEEGLKIEKELFLELLANPESAAQRYYFFAEREAGRIPDVPSSTPQRDIKSVGVIGAGLMGGGIAMCFASAGLPVTVVEQKPEALERGLANIRKTYEGSVAKGRLTPEAAEKCIGLVTGTLVIEDLGTCDLVIEAVFERMDIKQQVFATLDRVCKPGAILATNTSALDIDVIAQATSRPEDVIGLHFFSPAHIMRLLEIVRADKTAKDVIATAMAVSRKIGKIAVLAGVCPGFIGNRILFPRQRQADALSLEGVLPWDVDRVLTQFGLPMGPFAMSDMAGLDLGWVKAESKSSSVREILNEMGRHGQKTRAGYYDYDENRRPTPSPVSEQVIRDFAASSGKPPRVIDDAEILDRCILPMVNEGAKILAEGKAIRASDIDVVWVNGYGWPVWKGGPMFYADQRGLAEVLNRLRELEAAHGAAFKPAALIEQLVSEGKSFSDFKQQQRVAEAA
jgi:3-hydroxyacyl-CoA dehydrogenase